MPRKFKLGDKVKVKDNIQIPKDDDEGVGKTVGRVGTIQSYAPQTQYPYNVEFDDPNAPELEDMMFKATELEKVN